MSSRSALAAAPVGLSTVSAQAQYQFQPILFEPPAPRERIDAPAVYDPGTHSLYVFGGNSNGLDNDLWAYSFDQAGWTELTPSGEVPAARLGHTMVFDPARRRLVVFGGQAGGFFNDVWAYGLGANAWQRLDGAGPRPNTRYGHGAVFDPPRDRMVISHGFTDQGRFDDTWAFDFQTNSWTEISPPNRRPLRRCLHHAVHHPASDQMLLFGGCASGAGPCPLNDLWAFDLGSHKWEQRASGPPARQWYGTALDRHSGRMVVFGGAGDELLGDVWEYDPVGDWWTQLSPGGAMPSARSRHEGAFVDGLGVVFFGGQTESGKTNQLWLLARATNPQILPNGVVNAFNFVGDGVAPGEIVSLFVSDAGPEVGVVTQFDPKTGLLPFTVAGVRVTWNGIDSPLYYVQKLQLNVQPPYEIAGLDEVEIVVTYGGGASPAVRLPVVATKAGLFPLTFNQDGSINSETNPAAAKSVVIFFLTGQGVTDPPSRTGGFPTDGFPVPVAGVRVEIGGVDSQLEFQGQAPFTAGVMQLNVRLADLQPAQHAVFVWVGEAMSQDGVTVWTSQ